MTEKVTPELIAELARYAGLPLESDRAGDLARYLDPALTKLRGMRPDGYENLAPDLNFRVPVPQAGDEQE